MRSKVRRVAETLLPRPGELQDLHHLLRRAHKTFEYWKQRFDRRTETVDSSEALDESKIRANQMRVEHDIKERSQLSLAILEQQLRVRVRQRPIMAHDAAAAAERTCCRSPTPTRDTSTARSPRRTARETRDNGEW